MRNWPERVLRFSLLFGISIALVAGFWFHGEFYQVGLYPLMLIGGLSVLLVVAGMRIALSKGPLLRRYAVEVGIDEKDMTGLVTGTQTAVAFPAESELPKIGELCFLVANSSHGSSRKHGRYAFVTSGRRVYSEELTENETRGEPDMLTILEFELVGGER